MSALIKWFATVERDVYKAAQQCVCGSHCRVVATRSVQCRSVLFKGSTQTLSTLFLKTVTQPYHQDLIATDYLCYVSTPVQLQY